MTSYTTITLVGDKLPTLDEFKAKLDRTDLERTRWDVFHAWPTGIQIAIDSKWAPEGGVEAAESCSRKWRTAKVIYESTWDDDEAGGDRRIFRRGKLVEAFEIGWIKRDLSKGAAL